MYHFTSSCILYPAYFISVAEHAAALPFNFIYETIVTLITCNTPFIASIRCTYEITFVPCFFIY